MSQGDHLDDVAEGDDIPVPNPMPMPPAPILRVRMHNENAILRLINTMVTDMPVGSDLVIVMWDNVNNGTMFGFRDNLRVTVTSKYGYSYVIKPTYRNTQTHMDWMYRRIQDAREYQSWRNVLHTDLVHAYRTCIPSDRWVSVVRAELTPRRMGGGCWVHFLYNRTGNAQRMGIRAGDVGDTIAGAGD